MSTRHIPADDFDRDDPTLVTDVMCPAITVRPDATIEEVARLLEGKKANRAAVIAADGKLLGVVTRAELSGRLVLDLARM